MEVKIGVIYSAKELVVELEAEAASLVETVETAIRNASVLWLTDPKGRRVGVPAEKLAYVEISDEDGHRRVGFGR